jgi:hypothetical protein
VGAPNRGKLNLLQQLLPDGLLVDSEWLRQRGYSRSLISKYLGSGWLESTARGVYRQPRSAFDPKGAEKWQLLVVSLQTLHNLPVAVGGRTALELQGYSHYLRQNGAQEIHLYSQSPLPRWVVRVPLEEQLEIHSTRLFLNSPDPAEWSGPEWRTLPPPTAVLPSQTHFTRLIWGSKDWPLIVSTPERAILELLDEVPHRETFEQADALFGGLTSLSPRRLQKLLADSRSVKTKRLFLWFAERHQHAWLTALDRSKIDLGTGKRMLVQGGRLDSKLLITVPESLLNER